jgi:RimJ/RimL family protein N-acetyltransferase
MIDQSLAFRHDDAAVLGVLIATPRLLLRRFTPADLDNLCALNGDSQVVRYLTGGDAIPRSTNEHFLAHYIAQYDHSDGFGVWALTERATGAFLGWCSLWDEGNRQAELGYRLMTSAWGRGIATEAATALVELGFIRLGVERIVASTYEENTGSRHVMEKLGMRFIRAFRPNDEDLHLTLGIGDYTDRFPKPDVEYAITRAQWEQRQSSKGAL